MRGIYLSLRNTFEKQVACNLKENKLQLTCNKEQKKLKYRKNRNTIENKKSQTSV